MTLEAKVGIFTVSGLLLAAIVIAHLSNFSFGKQPFYKVDIIFKNVEGLKPGSLVKYAGVTTGSVETIKISGTGALVTVKIKDEAKIPENSVATISSDGIMGENFVSIYTNDKENGQFLHNGSVIVGNNPRNINELMNTADKTLNKTTQLMEAMNDIIGNKDFQSSIIQSAVNMREITENMKRTTDILMQFANSNQGNINDIIQNLDQTMISMNKTMNTVEGMVNEVNNNGEFAQNIKATLKNIELTSASIQKMTANLEPVIANPKTAQDLSTILDNAKDISVRTNKLMTKLDNIKLKKSVDMLYDTKKKQPVFNAEMKINADKNNFLLIGADGIGSDDNGFNLQLGKGNGYTSYRLGIVDNYAGVGVDTGNDAFKLSADMYDFKDLRIKLKGQYRLSEGLYLLSQINDINHSDLRKTYIGIRKEF